MKEDKNLFHVNWGWRGADNGYYNLENCGYSNGQEIIIGIAPKHTGTTHARITFSKMTEVLTPKCLDGVNDKLRYEVHNADSYECHVYDRSGKKIWACAGLIKDGYADMWDGSANSSLSSTDYWYKVVFKNNFGDRVEYESNVTLLNLNCPNGYDPSTTDVQEETDLILSFFEKSKPILSPNPTSSFTQITSETIIRRVNIIDMKGRVLLSESIDTKNHIIDVNNFDRGIYFVYIITDDATFIKHLIVK